MMKKKAEGSPDSGGGDKGNFKSKAAPNGAYVNKDRGAKLGQGMQDIIGTEKVSNPFGE